MRIRRLASKILGTVYTLRPPPSPPPAVVNDSSNGYFCRLNQSPWDVFSSQYPEEVDEIEIGKDGIDGEEVMSAVTSNAAVPDIEVTAPICEESNGMQEEHDSKPKQAPEKVKTSKGKTEIVKKDVEYVESVGSFICKKTDGKQWQCKRPADKPNSFCNYHREKHRCYDKKKAKAPASMTASRCNQSQSKTAKSPAVADICEYSAWQGKQQREGDIDCLVSVALEEVKEQSKNEETLDCDQSNATVKNDSLEVSDKEERRKRKDKSLEDSEEEEKQKRLNRHKNNPQSRKRKRRKPVKERSLASLLM